MTGTQYTNVVHWTLANSPAADSAAAAKAVFNNMGVAFPSGSCLEILITLLSEEYMGWMSCTCQQAREFANAGVATVGVDPSRVVVILPDQPADALLSGTAAETAYAREAGDLALTERASMQFFAYAAASTTTTTRPKSWSYYANKVVNAAVAQLGKTYDDFAEGGALHDSDIYFNEDAWCVDFVRWCCKQAGVYRDDIVPGCSSTTIMRDWYRNNLPNCLYSGHVGIVPGDIVFVGYRSNPNNLRHTCIATSSMDVNGNVETINGNWGNKVAYQTLPYDTYVISSYAQPPYTRANP